MNHKLQAILVVIALFLGYVYVAQAQIGTTSGILRSVSSIDCFGSPGSGDFGSVVVTRNDNDVTVAVTLTGGLPDTTFTIELWEADPDCFPDNNGNTGVLLTTDSSGNGAALVTLSLPYPSLGGSTLGDGTGTEQIVVALDRSLSQEGGDTYATEPILLPGSNQTPNCSIARPSLDTLTQPDLQFVPIAIYDVLDPESDPVSITVNSIRQDEPVSTKDKNSVAPDGRGIGNDTAEVRAERLNSGNGRVYHIGFTANDGRGGTCTGEVRVSVPKKQGKNATAIDDGPIYDSTIP